MREQQGFLSSDSESENEECNVPEIYAPEFVDYSYDMSKVNINDYLKKKIIYLPTEEQKESGIITD